MPYQRKYDFQPGTKASSSQVDEEFNQLIAAVNKLETDDTSKDTALRSIAQLSKITADTGAPKLAITDTAKNLLTELVSLGVGKHTFYAAAGVQGLPNTNSFRGDVHITSAGFALLTGQDPTGTSYTNYLDNGTWKGWKQLDVYVTPTWFNIPLANGAQAYAAGTPLQYCKIGDIVFIRGALKNINSTGVFGGVLPFQATPVGQSHHFVQGTSITAGKIRTARWQINTSGQVVLDGNSDNVYSVDDFYPINTSFVCESK